MADNNSYINLLSEKINLYSIKLEKGIQFQLLSICLFMTYLFTNKLPKEFEILSIKIEIEILQLICPAVLMYLLMKYAINLRAFSELSEEFAIKYSSKRYSWMYRPNTFFLPIYFFDLNYNIFRVVINYCNFIALSIIPGANIAFVLFAIWIFCTGPLMLFFLSIFCLLFMEVAVQLSKSRPLRLRYMVFWVILSSIAILILLFSAESIGLIQPVVNVVTGE